ncbi:MAG: 3-methyl-2-oxobutanoate hydroxymethyltransferase [Candidatus Omnitrophica bacterium]|nr:3-methyl-2-oxobutanoate hydroxymethyltransferase [Candidatus Omnitrophota bacterium]MCM8793883.1 3-methyl-2-oxobutanoate hydroxymethyltransferase [Candidatus Omnitrophota bacterium]
MERKKMTIPDILEAKNKGKKITMLTAYDFPLASFIDQAGIDIILVGDSLGMVVLGYENTLPVTMEEMLHHIKAVKRAIKYALLVGDMPYLSFHKSKEDAIYNAGRFIKEAGCDAVKLEYYPGVIEITKAIVQAGIPVMGHIGLTPQTAIQLGGFKVQGREAKAAQALLEAAVSFEEVGCFSIVLECVPDKVAKIITGKLKIPTIGIGAGPDCDGQVLVTHDMLGLFERFLPKFAKQYINLAPQIIEAIKKFKEEVEKGVFPDKSHSFTIPEEELKKIKY